MKFKLDENLDSRLAVILRNLGHDVATILQQSLGGSPDGTVFTVCVRENRCLVTLDLDFSNLLDYPPEKSAGIVILRSPSPRLSLFKTLIRQLGVALKDQSPSGHLWIVEPGRIRIHESEADR